MMTGLDHVNIVVEDLPQAVAFYRDTLGLKEVLRARLEGDWIQEVTGLAGVSADCVYLQPPEGPRIELLCYLSPTGASLDPRHLPNQTGIRHLAFRVENIDAEYERLKAAGVRFVSAPFLVPLAKVSKVSGQKRLCYFRDPEGNILEIAEFKPVSTGSL